MKRWALVCAFSALGWAQGEKKLAYDVISIKPHAADDRRIMINFGSGSGGRLNVTGVPLALLIQLAYTEGGIGGPFGPGSAAKGLPDWASSDRFDIEARPEAGFVPNQEQQREMLRALLEERFQLKAHKESKDGPVYALVVGKNGPKMKLSADQTPLPGPGERPAAGAAGPTPAPPALPPPPGPNFNPRTATLSSMPRGMIMNGPGVLRATAQTMTRFVSLLSGQAGRPVVDRTGLTAFYDIELSFASTQQLPPGMVLPPGVTLPEADPNLPSIFTAVQEQLGLKLEPATAPLDSIVVDHVEKPTEN